MCETLAGKQILVIGASGFIGGRLAERLVLEHGARVRVLVRRIMSAAPLARFPIDVIQGDILDVERLNAAATGCALIFNCAKGKGADAKLRRGVDVDGVRHVVEAASRNGACVVHVSTMAVYGGGRDTDVTEQSPDAPPGDSYVDNKLAGERLALKLSARLHVPLSVVQPSVVYGPEAGTYGSEILNELHTNRLILVNGGSGVCNAVYVDDVVTALQLAAVSPAAAGERFLISGPEYPLWVDFFNAFECMLGVANTVSLSEPDTLRVWRRSRRRRSMAAELIASMRADQKLRRRLLNTREGALARRVAQRIFPPRILERTRRPAGGQAPRSDDDADALPLVPIRPWVVDFMAKRARVRIDKARQVLGYEPAFTLSDGMRLTEAWARWAGLIPARDDTPASR